MNEALSTFVCTLPRNEPEKSARHGTSFVDVFSQTRVFINSKHMGEWTLFYKLLSLCN